MVFYKVVKICLAFVFAAFSLLHLQPLIRIKILNIFFDSDNIISCFYHIFEIFIWHFLEFHRCIMLKELQNSDCFLFVFFFFTEAQKKCTILQSLITVLIYILSESKTSITFSTGNVCQLFLSSKQTCVLKLKTICCV